MLRLPGWDFEVLRFGDLGRGERLEYEHGTLDKGYGSTHDERQWLDRNLLN